MFANSGKVTLSPSVIFGPLSGFAEPPVAISSDLLPLSVSIAKCGYESNFCLFVPNVNLNGPKS